MAGAVPVEHRDSDVVVVLAPRAGFVGGAFEVLWSARVSIRHDFDQALLARQRCLGSVGQVTAVYSRWNDGANEL